MKKTLLFLILTIFIVLSACSSDKKKSEKQETVQAPSEKFPDGKYCFLKTVKNDPIKIDGKVVQEMIDSTQVYFTKTGKEVTGVFNYLPAEMDSRRGTFNGGIDNKGKIKAIYVFNSEGETYKEGVIIQLKEDRALVKLAELDLIPGQGDLVVTDNENKFEELQKINCTSVKY